MTDEKIQDLLATLSFNGGDAMRVVEAMGATYQTTAEASKQGGGGANTNHAWPAKTGYPYLVEWREVQEVRGIFRLILHFNCRALLRVTMTGGGAVYEAEVWRANVKSEKHSARGRIPETALWVAMIRLWRT